MNTNQLTANSSRMDPRFGFFSFFTGAGFLDLGFEDARKDWWRKEIGPLDF